MFDTNILYGNWPFDYLPQYSPQAFVDHLESEGISGGLIACLDAVFQRDLDRCNAEHLERFEGLNSAFIPVITVNPLYKNWKAQLESLTPNVIKLYPNYHGYELNAPCVNRLFNYCQKNNILVLLAMRIEDERSHPPAFMVPGMSAEAVVEAAKSHTSLKILCLSAYYYEATLLIKETENLYVEHSFIERLYTLKTMLETCPQERLLFGTHTPLFYTQANIRKVTLSGLPEDVTKKIAQTNAEALLAQPFGDRQMER